MAYMHYNIGAGGSLGIAVNNNGFIDYFKDRA